MIIPDLVGLNIGTENWGNNPDDFWIVVQADIGPNNGKGSETFTFNVTSPKRLSLLLQESSIEIGRGLLIMEDYNIRKIESSIAKLIENCIANTWYEVVLLLTRYSYWEYE